MKYFFVLGARDPEMMEIVRVLESQNIGYTFATLGGKPVSSSEAYKATGVQGQIPRDHWIVYVECEVMGLLADDVCDHHNPGDPGFGMPPERFLEGSSLGQVLKLLGIEPSEEQKIIAAADHCLRHAYNGDCPGIDPEKLAEWRERSRASLRGITVLEIQARIEKAKEVLRTARRIRVAGEEVAFFPANEIMPEEVPEASARLGIPFCYVRNEGQRGKAGIMSGGPRLISTWMKECGLSDVYGDPARGFAGGYSGIR